MQTITYFDIETGPLSIEQITPLMPEFEAPGNIKDPEKIASAIKAKQTNWIEQAALSAISGRVLCIGVIGEQGFESVGALEHEGTEDLILRSFWLMATLQIQRGDSLVGFCCKMFDLPFLIRRSWAHSIAVPKCIWNGRYFSDQIVDVAEKWECGVRGGDHISLDSLAKFLGIGQKIGEGKDFAGVWETDKPKALDYLRNDLELTKKAYERISQ